MYNIQKKRKVDKMNPCNINLYIKKVKKKYVNIFVFKIKYLCFLICKSEYSINKYYWIEILNYNTIFRILLKHIFFF